MRTGKQSDQMVINSGFGRNSIQKHAVYNIERYRLMDKRWSAIFDSNHSVLATTAKNWMAKRTIERDSRYATSEWTHIETVFFGKGTNAKDAYYGSITLPHDVSNGTFEFEVTAQYGNWFSDGASHTVDLANAYLVTGFGQPFYNIIWIAIPTTNISLSSSVCWMRLHIRYRVT